jgi:hypothetical protein
VVASKALLSLMQCNQDEFFHRFVTVDETWIHHYSPETKEQSKQWIEKGEPCPKKAKTVKSAGKVMATVFWDAFHQDNARVHTCLRSMAKIEELKFELVDHPPYSPDSAPVTFSYSQT